jgi:hypothetical protein
MKAVQYAIRKYKIKDVPGEVLTANVTHFPLVNRNIRPCPMGVRYCIRRNVNRPHTRSATEQVRSILSLTAACVEHLEAFKVYQPRKF